MYRHEDYDQLKMEMPFGVTVREDNRWVILSKKFPWKEIDREYQEHFKSSEGHGTSATRRTLEWTRIPVWSTPLR